jgi:hypothetical protein
LGESLLEKEWESVGYCSLVWVWTGSVEQGSVVCVSMKICVVVVFDIYCRMSDCESSIGGGKVVLIS